MMEVLEQFKNCICKGPPRSLQRLPRDTLHLFTDACCDPRRVAGLGGALLGAAGDRVAC